MNRIEFPAEFSTVFNEESGEVFLLLSPRDEEQEYAVARRDFLQYLDANPAMKPEVREKQIAEFDARQLALKNRRKEEREALADTPQLHRFRLVRPTHGQLERIIGEATEFDPESGGQRFDGMKYRTLLLQNDGVKDERGQLLSASAIEDLDPVIAAELGRRLVRSLEVDKRRLVFVSRASEATS